jgi:hypothetical protein
MGKQKEIVTKSGTGSVEVLPSTFKALSLPSTQLASVLKNNLGGATLRPFDLDRVKVPSGGGSAWEVPTLRGPQVVQTLEGIILHMRDQRSYWSARLGNGSGNNPPDCFSNDLIVGTGKPGGSCSKCAFAQFGSTKNQDGSDGRGQACKQSKLLLFLRQEDVIPLALVVPPSSLRAAGKYFLRLAGASLPYQAVVTQLRLKKTKNATGIEYAEIDFALGRELAEEEIGKSLAIAEAMREAFGTMTVDHTDVG